MTSDPKQPIYDAMNRLGGIMPRIPNDEVLRADATCEPKPDGEPKQ